VRLLQLPPLQPLARLQQLLLLLRQRSQRLQPLLPHPPLLLPRLPWVCRLPCCRWLLLAWHLQLLLQLLLPWLHPPVEPLPRLLLVVYSRQCHCSAFCLLLLLLPLLAL
jgi:hypothetical protein